jgi:hypothetical protein
MISIIIPAYNVDSCLERCLESVLHQSYTCREVIVIEDGSTDTTADIISKYSHKINWASQKNQGPSAARNLGLKLARGDFVAFLDADDFWLPDFLTRCIEFFEKNPETAAVSTGQKIVNWKGEVSINPPLLRDEREKKQPQMLSHFFRFWAEQDHIRTGTCLIRRSLVEKAGHLREELRLGEDLEYWGYLATFGNWGFIPEVLWVGDGFPCAATQGWLNKNRQRRHSCLTVEEWQKRIAPRLRARDRDWFGVVRGRVAQTFAYAKLLGGDISGARQITRCYGEDFPVNPVSRIFKWLAPKGLITWRFASLVFLSREAWKGWRLNKLHGHSGKGVSLSMPQGSSEP